LLFGFWQISSKSKSKNFGAQRKGPLRNQRPFFRFGHAFPVAGLHYNRGVKNAAARHSFRWTQVSTFRLTRHHLMDRNRPDLDTVCGDVCGIQAQVMAAAQIAFWARMHTFSAAVLHGALFERRILIKTSPFENFSKSIRTKIEQEAGSLARFLEIPFEIKFCK
jgi:hypothetical protein